MKVDMEDRRLLPPSAHIPAIVGLGLWGVCAFYFFFVGTFGSEFFVPLKIFIPGTAKYLDCYSVDENIVFSLIIFAWMISFLVTVSVILITRNSKEFYISVRKKLDVVKSEKFSGRRRIYYWLAIVFLYGIVVFPYSRHMFGYDLIGAHCPPSALVSTSPNRGLILEALIIISAGEILGGLISYVKGKILINKTLNSKKGN